MDKSPFVVNSLIRGGLIGHRVILARRCSMIIQESGEPGCGARSPFIDRIFGVWFKVYNPVHSTHSFFLFFLFHFFLRENFVWSRIVEFFMLRILININKLRNKLIVCEFFFSFSEIGIKNNMEK